MVFKDLLISWLTYQGITQTELAEEMNVSKSFVSQYVRGKRKNPGPNTREKFAEGFKLTLTDFMEGPIYSTNFISNKTMEFLLKSNYVKTKYHPWDPKLKVEMEWLAKKYNALIIDIKKRIRGFAQFLTSGLTVELKYHIMDIIDQFEIFLDAESDYVEFHPASYNEKTRTWGDRDPIEIKDLYKEELEQLNYKLSELQKELNLIINGPLPFTKSERVDFMLNIQILSYQLKEKYKPKDPDLRVDIKKIVERIKEFNRYDPIPYITVLTLANGLSSQLDEIELHDYVISELKPEEDSNSLLWKVNNAIENFKDDQKKKNDLYQLRDKIILVHSLYKICIDKSGPNYSVEDFERESTNHLLKNKYIYNQNDDLCIVENSTDAELLGKGYLDILISTAIKFPRNIKKSIQDAIIISTIDEETAALCFYYIPMGNKYIEGPGISLGTIVCSAWRNMRTEARVVSEDYEYVTARGIAHDLENNSIIGLLARQKIIDNNGKRFNEDIINFKVNIACSIALRDAILSVIPKAIVDKIYEEVKKYAIGDSSTLTDRRVRAIDSLVKMGVNEDRIFANLRKRGIEDIDLNDLGILLGLRTAIKDSIVTIEEVFPPLEEKDNH